MEQVNGEGERREVDPSMLAQFDQMEAHFQDVTGSLLGIRAAMKMAATENNTAEIALLTNELETIVRAEWPNAAPLEINYIMFLLHLVEQAKLWTEMNYDAINAVIRQLGALTPPSHPIKALKGFSQEDLESDLAAALNALDGPSQEEDSFTTDSGVQLFNVHAADKCDGEFCVIHNPAPGPWANWDTHWREDWRLMVRVCPHGVNHVAVEEMLRMPLLGLIGHEHPAECNCPCDFSRCSTITDDEGNILGFQANA